MTPSPAYLTTAPLATDLTRYRQDEKITQAMLSFVLHAFKCISKGETTIAVFIDLGGAFDAVCQDGVAYIINSMKWEREDGCYFT